MGAGGGAPARWKAALWCAPRFAPPCHTTCDTCKWRRVRAAAASHSMHVKRPDMGYQALRIRTKRTQAADAAVSPTRPNSACACCRAFSTITLISLLALAVAGGIWYVHFRAFRRDRRATATAGLSPELAARKLAECATVRILRVHSQTQRRPCAAHAVLLSEKSLGIQDASKGDLLQRWRCCASSSKLFTHGELFATSAASS